MSSFSLILESNWVLQNVCRMSFKTFNRQSDSLIIEKKDITDTESVGLTTKLGHSNYAQDTLPKIATPKQTDTLKSLMWLGEKTVFYSLPTA